MRIRAAVWAIIACLLTCTACAFAEAPSPLLCPPGEYAVDLTTDLHPGDSGVGVAALQNRLASLGYYFAEENLYGVQTEQAVRLFEEYLNDRQQTDAMGAALSLSSAPAAPQYILVDGIADIVVLERLFAVEDGCYWQDLRMGDASTEVLRLQNRLCMLGYLSGERDGTFGGQTRSAIRAFQYATHCKEDGIADQQTQQLLFSQHAPYARYAACALGDKTPNVQKLQLLLMRLGFMEATSADGNYGKNTEAAVRAAQTYLQRKDILLGVHAQQSSLPALGLPTKDQGYAITEASAPVTTPSQPLQVPGEAFFYNGEDPYAINVNGIADSLLHEYLATQDTLAFIGTQKKDDWNAEVERIQRRLYSLEYLYTKADGVYGANTEKAVLAFQKRNALPETGECDKETVALLFSDACKAHMHTYKLVVDISEQRVYAYTYDENEKYTEIVRKMTCSSGRRDTPTPTGTFTNTGRGARWHFFKKFDTWAQYAFYIDGDIMFHSVLFNSDDTSTLIKSSQRNLGSRASHGCVRLAVDDAKWIWNNCDQHTTVVVQE